jgi:hypothetical protein
MPSKGWITTFVASAVVMACGVGSAQATVVDQGHFTVTDHGEPDGFCGFSFVRDTDISGSYRIRAPQSGGGQAFLQRVNLRETDVFTNTANGKSFSFETSEVSNELSATHVDGNVYEFTTIEAGQPFTLRDSSGQAVYRDRGNIRRVITFDTLGDGQPGGNELSETVVRVSGPHPAFESTDAEFCGVIAGLVG